MNTYTVKVYDRKDGKTAHDAILVKGIKSDNMNDAIIQALENYNPLPGESFYAEVENQQIVPPELIGAVEFGYKCCEQGLNIQATIEKFCKVRNG